MDHDLMETTSTNERSMSMTVEISSLIIKDYNNEFVDVYLEDSSSYLMNPGQPMLPKVVKTVELEFGAKNVEVEVTPKDIQEYEIIKKVRPSPTPMLLTVQNVETEYMEVEEVYSSGNPFPSTWFSYRVGCGLNADNEHVTHVAIHVYPVRYTPSTGKLCVAGSADITVTYEDPESNPFPANNEYDLVIIAPSKFASDLQELVDHKNTYGVNTLFKTTEDIYNEYSGVDKPEQIKYFIKDAIETWNIKYVMLVGGMKSLLWGKPRDDSNQGTQGWYVPVRYTNLYDNPKYPLNNVTIRDPGVISDLYYADIYKEGGEFEDWDPNGDGIFAAWGKPDVENDTGIDMYPDVSVGRLACRNKFEVKSMVDKIINYETNTYGKDWFNKMIVVSGDGFLDQEDLNIEWDVNSLPDGDYTIYAQSTNPDMVSGPVDVINVTLDRSKETSLTFNHDDHLKFDSYPYIPIAEITSPSEGDILGNTDFFRKLNESEAYCNEFLRWADLNYTDGIMHIRGKSYDPQPYGVVTDIYVWINNSAEETVFDHTVEDTKMYFEGEWVTGERLLKGRGGALYYMPDEFDEEFLWTSNGEWTGQSDVINAFSEGSGFTFFSGHGNPIGWGNHLAGVPGNRQNSHVTGLYALDIFGGPPFFPMERLSNKYKNPVVVVGGCHNSQFNVTLFSTLLDRDNSRSTWCSGMPVPECWSWWLTKLSKRGAIATIGNTGLGYGVIGEDCTSVGLDGGICIEFFKQYSEGHQILGDAYRQTQANYVTTFDMAFQEHGKTLQQWVLLGDPSLMIGGYSPGGNNGLNVKIDCAETSYAATSGETITFNGMASNGLGECTYEWDFDNDGEYDDATGETVTQSWYEPGVYVVSLRVTDSLGEVDICDTVVSIEPHTSTPDTPKGETNINAGETYTYSTNLVETNVYWNIVYYKYDWGDGTFSDWLGPYDNDEEVRAPHSWDREGSYAVGVIALLIHYVPGDIEDEDVTFTDWSPPLNLYVNQQSNYLNGQKQLEQPTKQ